MINIPFKYKVIDNFFEDKDFKDIRDIILNSDDYKNIKSDGATIFKFDDKFKLYLIEKYKQKLIDTLKELNPSKISLIDYIEFTATITGKDHTYPIHNDQITKVLSTVIYINPLNNTGTFIYDDNKNNQQEIGWKENRAFIFSRKDKSTWHSYKSDNLNSRCTIIFTLRTNKINKAYIIDRGLLMFLINKIRSIFLK